MILIGPATTKQIVNILFVRVFNKRYIKHMVKREINRGA